MIDVALLPDIIRRTRDEYAARGISTWQIGNGWCDEFASDVLKIWVGPDWVHREGDDFRNVETANFLVRDETSGDAVDWDWKLLERHWDMSRPTDVPEARLVDVAMREPTHIWIAARGRHYDAEHPEGMASFLDMGFFRRWLEPDARRAAA